MVLRILVNGAQGKMGSLTSQTIEQHPDFSLVAKIGRKDSLADAIALHAPDIVIDLTRADCVYSNAITIIEHNVHPVIGTSGLDDTQIKHLQSLCEKKQLGGIIAPNFSIGVVLMMRCAEIAAPYLHAVEIIEAHHPEKFDAPSSTAVKTAKMIAAVQEKPQEIRCQELLPGALGCKQDGIPIHSLRLPGILAEQQVIFGQKGETLTITHKTAERAAFMPGIILCCQKVSGLNSLYYGLENLL